MAIPNTWNKIKKTFRWKKKSASRSRPRRRSKNKASSPSHSHQAMGMDVSPTKPALITTPNMKKKNKKTKTTTASRNKLFGCFTNTPKDIEYNVQVHPSPPSPSSPSLPHPCQKQQQQQQQQQQRRDPALEQDHQKWLRSMSKFFQMFKYQPCLKAALCPKHLNCMRYHSDDDKRRALVSEVDGSLAYVGEPCPQVFDYWNTQTFMTNYVCPKKEKCEYAHNWYEFGYHHRTYKTVKCPYLKLADMVGTYQTKECPFVRSEQWVVQNLPELKIKKVSRNMIHFHGAQVAAIDLCPFYHDEKERRFHDDPPFPAPSSSKAMRGGPPSEHSSSQAHAPYQQQQQQQQPVYPHQQPQAQSYQPQSAPYQPQPPPQQQQQGMPMNMAPHHNNQVVPPHMKPHAQQQQQQQPLYQQQQPLHQQPLHQPRSQQTLFAPPQKSTVDLQAAQAEKNDFKVMQIDYGDNNW